MDNDSGSDDDNAVEKTFIKGPWTEEEDNILLAYIEKHGDRNWNNVQRTSTLSRSGKSCRLRWVNQLRPNLTKGALTDEEEKRVVELHAEIGNKWSKIAAKLPGRTDNEIKNFWNVRRKRLQRLGLPLYPSEVLERVMNAAAQSGLNPDPLDAPLEVDNDELPTPDFKLLPNNPFLSDYQSMVSNFTPITGSFLREIRPCFLQPIMYNSAASPSGTAYLRQMPYVFEPNNMYNSTASPSGMALPFTGGGSMNEQSLPCVIQSNMYNSIASPSGMAFPFTSGGSMNEQSLPVENYPFVDSTSSFLRQGPCFIQPNMYNSIASPSGTALPLTDGGSMNEQCLPLDNYPFAESTLEHAHVLDNATHYPLFEPLIHSELPSFQVFDSHEETRTLEAQQCGLISDNTLVQPPLTDQTPPIDYGSSLYDDEFLELIGSPGATETDPEFPLDMSSFLGHSDLPPSTLNTTGQNFNFGSTSLEEISSDDYDWIKLLLDL